MSAGNGTAFERRRDEVLRAETARRVGIDSIPDDLWARLRKLADNAEDLALHYRLWMRADLTPSSDASARWRAHSDRVLETIRPLRPLQLAMLNLSDTLPVAHLREFLRAQKSLESDDGASCALSYPSPDGDAPETMTVHSGPNATDEWGRNKQPLYRLAMTARVVSAAIGLPEWQAVGFLICDERYVLPSVTVVPRVLVANDEGRALRAVFEVTVWSAAVNPLDVADAYRRVRDEMRAPGVLPMTRAERAERVAAFIKETPKMTYDERHEAWNRQEGLHAKDRFDSGERMSQWVRRARHDGVMPR